MTDYSEHCLHRQPLTPDSLHNEPQNIKKEEKEGVNLVDVYRAMLRIVARLESTSYTQSTLCQTVERQPDDLADPASDSDTTQD